MWLQVERSHVSRNGAAVPAFRDSCAQVPAPQFTASLPLPAPASRGGITHGRELPPGGGHPACSQPPFAQRPPLDRRLHLYTGVQLSLCLEGLQPHILPPPVMPQCEGERLCSTQPLAGGVPPRAEHHSIAGSGAATGYRHLRQSHRHPCGSAGGLPAASGPMDGFVNCALWTVLAMVTVVPPLGCADQPCPGVLGPPRHRRHGTPGLPMPWVSPATTR